MATLLAHPQQLSFSWDDSPFSVSNECPTVAQAEALGSDARAAQAPGPAAVVVVRTVSPKVNTSVEAPAPQASVRARSGQPQHISGLMAAVLARYGIDPNEFMEGLE